MLPCLALPSSVVTNVTVALAAPVLVTAIPILQVPWKEFFKSPPVWAVTVAHFCFNWGYYTLLAWLPSYFEMALGLNVQESSFLTLIPYVAMILMTPVVSAYVIPCDSVMK